MRRAAAVLVPAVLLASAPAAAASACGAGQRVESLQLALAPAAETHRPGQRTAVPLTVTRAGVPAADVEVFARLRSKTRRGEWAWGSTDEHGRAVLRVLVPEDVRGDMSVEAEGLRELAHLTCVTVQEHGATAGAWGRAAS